MPPSGPDLTAAVLHHKAGRMAEAEASYRRALAWEPAHPHAWHLLGLCAGMAGRPLEAARAFLRALRLPPQGDAVLVNLVHAATLAAEHELAESRPDTAARLDRLLVALDPAAGTGWARLAAAAALAGRHPEALAAGYRAVRLLPGLAEGWANLTVACNALGRFEEAEEHARRGLAIRPDHVDGWQSFSRASAYGRGGPEAAVRALDRALHLSPARPLFRWNRGFMLLLAGRLAAGWPDYEWRHALFQPELPDPRRWRGSDPDGRTLLLGHEQGLGDVIQFVRYAALLQRRGARVLLECPPSLKRLLATAPGIDHLVAAGGERPAYDAFAPLLSVPGLVGTTMETIPAPIPYLSAEPDRVAFWRRRLDGTPAGRPGLRVGLVWHGSPTGGRSVPLAAFLPLARVPGVRLISLQKHGGLEQLADPEAAGLVETLGEDFDAGPDAFIDTAAVLCGLDLLVSVDTAAAHVAGALGRPVWLALGPAPDWRWFLDRGDTPWYPAHRLFRRPRSGDWHAVGAAMAEELSRLASESAAPAPITPAPLTPG